MTPREVLATGNLEAALAEVGARLRANPELAREHVFLFEILVLAGRWEKARQRLDVLEHVAPSNQSAYQFWRTAIAAEEQRREVFAGTAAPRIVGEPEPWLPPLVGALADEAGGRVAEARAARARALAQAPAWSGDVTGPTGVARGGDLRDVDDRLGPVIEMLWLGRYYWLPFSRVARLRAARAGKLRLVDVAWFPVNVTLVDGTDVDALVPTRYPGSENDPDPLVRVGTKTEIAVGEPGETRGRGQRLFASGAEEWPLVELVELVRHLPS